MTSGQQAAKRPPDPRGYPEDNAGPLQAGHRHPDEQHAKMQPAEFLFYLPSCAPCPQSIRSRASAPVRMVSRTVSTALFWRASVSCSSRIALLLLFQQKQQHLLRMLAAEHALDRVQREGPSVLSAQIMPHLPEVLLGIEAAVRLRSGRMGAAAPARRKTAPCAR